MFISFVLAFIIAVFGFYQLSNLPTIWDGLLLGVIFSVFFITSFIAVSGFQQSAVFGRGSILDQAKRNQYDYLGQLIKKRLINAYLGFIIGVCWVFGQTFFAVQLEEAWLNKPVQLQGTISSLVVETKQAGRVRLRFKFKVDKIQALNGQVITRTLAENSVNTSVPIEKPKPIVESWSLVKPTVQLSWYLSQAQYQQLTHQPRNGQTWQWVAKLKANHSSMNLGALDYETYLFQNRIDAGGYLLLKPDRGWHANLVEPASGVNIRAWLAQRLSTVFEDSSLKGLYKALAYGDKSDITDTQWQVLQNTGTIHLMAISGLHMAIVSALGYWVFKGIWWLWVYRTQRITLPMFGAVGALLFATFYLVLAGYAIPTQRAYIMVLAALLFLVLRRKFQPWSALALAGLMVVLWDSRSVLSLGFWLSFLAVALIFATLRQPLVKRLPNSLKMVWIQLTLTFGLAPFLIWAFHFLPSYSFISNLFAVPFVTLVGLPILFFVSLITFVSIDLAQWLMPLIDLVWQALWWPLSWVSSLPFSSITLGQLNGWGLLMIYGALFMALLSRTKWVKIFSVMTLLVALFFSWSSESRPQNGQASLNVLDVGQGQAVVIETKNHVLIYDTGAKWGDKMDGVKLAVLPFLRARNWSQVDYVMISHADMDHAGGLERLVESMSIKHISSGQPNVINDRLREYRQQQPSLPLHSVELCRAGDSWVWDGVAFDVLAPGLPELATKLTNNNDQSCVLKVTAGEQSVLIPGDVSTNIERDLIAVYGNKLQSTIIVAGHHGSRHSTSKQWLDMVKPEVVLFTTGYKNRYKFPAEDTLKRLDESIVWFNTGCSGGVGYQLGVESFDPRAVYQARKTQQKWYHHRCLKDEKGRAYQ